MILLIDDLRDFLPQSRPQEYIVARTCAAGLAVLHELDSQGTAITELWLDHDLGGDDNIMPVVDYLNERGYNGNHFPVDNIYVHTMNSARVAAMLAGFERYGYTATRVVAKEHLINVIETQDESDDY